MKKILSTVLSILILVGAVMSVSSLFKKIDEESTDGMERIYPEFSVGGLTNSGKYTKTKYTLYTKDSIECSRMVITPDFESNLEYQVFFFREKDSFVSCTDVLSGTNEITLPEGAVSARLVLIPVWDANVQEKDKELGFLEAVKFGLKLTVEVAYEKEEAAEAVLEECNNKFYFDNGSSLAFI